MEWKRVKSILIGVLLITCLLLAGNLVRQTQELRIRRQEAVQAACTFALQHGLSLDPVLVLALPEQPEVLSAARDSQLELALARTLLGADAALEEPGGGVSLYSGTGGRLSIRRGGAFELALTGARPPEGEAGWATLLSEAGLDLGGSAPELLENETVFLQTVAGGASLVNCRLSCTADEAGLLVSGRWLLTEALPSGEHGASRAELVLALALALADRPECGEVTALSVGYYLENAGIRNLRLTPVWIAETSGGRVLLDTVTKAEIPAG